MAVRPIPVSKYLVPGNVILMLSLRPPPIVAHQGDTVLVHAYNGLGDPFLGTSLHTHGLAFNGTNYYDGGVGITQCAIPKNQTMSYSIDTSLQVGFSLL